jgi:hypothetical protein
LAAVVLAVVLVKGRSSQTKPCDLDPLCCAPTEEQSAIVRCFCGNSTGGAYGNLTEEGKLFYGSLNSSLLILDPTYTVEVDSCHPYNQILLAAGESAKAFNLTTTQLTSIPIDVFVSDFVLVHTFVTMDGLHWDQSDKWLSIPDLCYWYGVGCLFIEILHELRLPQNGLSGTLSPLWGRMNNLQVLDLSGNIEIEGTIPPEMAFMVSLNTLSLSKLRLTGTIPAALGFLDRLSVLLLNQNELTGTLPAELFQLSTLLKLELAGNMLVGSIPTQVGQISNQLTALRLNDNQLNGTLPSELGNLERLELLNIGNNQFEGTIPDFLGSLPRLQYISLYESGLTGSIPETFCSSRSSIVGLRRTIVVNCETTLECSCCSKDLGSNQLVKLRCGESLPEFASGIGL